MQKHENYYAEFKADYCIKPYYDYTIQETNDKKEDRGIHHQLRYYGFKPETWKACPISIDLVLTRNFGFLIGSKSEGNPLVFMEKTILKMLFTLEETILIGFVLLS
jgi:hypothetical protein